MPISNVEITLVDPIPGQYSRLRAFAGLQLTLHDHGTDLVFFIRDVKVVDGAQGVFVGMPSRKVTDRCSGCSGKNCLDAAYCNWCGARRDRQVDFEVKRHADVAFPMDQHTRDMVTRAVLDAYQDALRRKAGAGG